MITLDAKEYFTEYLRNKKHRITPERFEVLNAVIAYEGHFDADELYLDMKSSRSKVSRATVYNTLDKLLACGIISRYRFGEKLARYELVFGREPHHHIICRACGKIEEFSDKRVERLARDAAETMRYHLQDQVLHIFGLCHQCVESRPD